MWQDVCSILSAWAGDETGCVTAVEIGGITSQELVNALGVKTPLKLWQVQRVIERIESFLDSAHKYDNILCDLGPYGEPGGNPLTGRYQSQADLLETTQRTLIHDTVDGQPSTIPLGMAIDLLMPCHWNFSQNLWIVLRAIGGDLQSPLPYATCARNIRMAPARQDMRVIVETLEHFCGEAETAMVAPDVLSILGKPTPAKIWLAASLSKTLRLQLHL
jgi:hypothetical protein